MNKSDPMRQLWLALVLLTRLPLPHLPQRAFEQGARAVWAYPVVGVFVGAGGAFVAMCAMAAGLPTLIAATLLLATMMLMTGAMHEDGLADVFDGFWGGFTPERRLEIMRDSQIGTYGVLALLIISLLRLSAVAALLGGGSWAAIVAAAALSRTMMPACMYALPHARGDGLSRSVGQPSYRATGAAFVTGAAIALLCLGTTAIIAAVLAVLVTACMAVLARRKIGGQTGDVLGAVQQLSEVAILLTCVSLL